MASESGRPHVDPRVGEAAPIASIVTESANASATDSKPGWILPAIGLTPPPARLDPKRWSRHPMRAALDR